MKLPNAERAMVDIRKVRDYCLDPTSPKGRNKARVFTSTLALTQRDSEFLQRALRRAACDESFIRGESDDYGQRYMVDFILETAVGRKRVRSGWIVRHGEIFQDLRLVLF